MLLLVLIPVLVEAEERVEITEKIDYNGKDDTWLHYTDESGKTHDSYLTNIVLGDGNTGYCIDPGISAPSPGTTNCVKKTLTGNDAVKALAVFNESYKGGKTDQDIGFALRYAFADTMKLDDDNQAIVNAYKTGQGTGADSAKSIADTAKSVAAKDKSSYGKAPEPKVSKKGNVISYSNMPKDTKVTIYCENCTETEKVEILPNSTGTFNIDLTGDSSKCVGGAADYTVTFEGSEVVTKEPSHEEKSAEPTSECKRVVVYTCGANSSSKFQRFMACDEVVSSSNGGSKPGDPDGDTITVNKELKGTIQCKDMCKNVSCPENDEFIDIPPEAPDGYEDELCDSLGIDERVMIDESDQLDTLQEIECCVLGKEEKKLTASASSSSICNPTIYCVEKYTFNVGRNAPFEIHPDDKQVITAGSYFQLKGEPFKDKSEFFCYTEYNTDKLKAEVFKSANRYTKGYQYSKSCGPELYWTEEDWECSTYDSEGNRTGSRNCTGYDGDSCCYSDESGYVTHSETHWTGQYPVYKSWSYYNASWTDSTKKEELYWHWSSSYDSYIDYSCEPESDYVPASVDSAALTEEVRNLVSEYETNCNQGMSGIMAKSINEPSNVCNNRGITFRYDDGSKLSVPQKLIKSSNGKMLINDCTTNSSGRTCVETTKEAGPGDTTQKNMYCTTDGSGNRVCNPPEKRQFRLYNGATVDFLEANYAEASISKTDEYILEGTRICNDYSKGERYFGDACNETICNDYNSNPDSSGTCVIGWPISYDTAQAEYHYSFHVDGIDSCINPTKFSSHDSTYDVNCLYEVNGCNGCNYLCDSIVNNCVNYDTDQDSCRAVGCIYDSRVGLTLHYQPISLINLDSSFAILNTNYSSVIKLANYRNNNSVAKINKLAASFQKFDTWENTKGTLAKNKIKNAGESIYSSKPEYSVTLKPTDIKEIQNYNKGKSYLDSDLVCKKSTAMVDKVDGAYEKYIVCESKFLNDFLPSKGIDYSPNFDGGKKFTSAMSELGVTSFDFKSGTGPAWK